MAWICGKRLKCMRNSLPMLHMANQFHKRLKYVETEVYMWEVA